MRYLLAAIILLATTSLGHAADTDWLDSVLTRYGCPLTQITERAEAVAAQRPESLAGECKVFSASPVTVHVLAVVGGPQTDWEGDTFYIVQVGSKNGGWYSLAWPGMNAPSDPGLDV